MARSKARRLALVIVAPMLVACNAILGISDYERGECPGGSACLDEGGPPDTGPRPDGGNDAGRDATPQAVDAQGAVPVSWARWPMPNYPQAEVDANVPTYNPQASSDAGAVVDSVSGLVWRPVADAEKKEFTFDEATKLCTDAKGGTWRLPTRIELVTLLDLGKTNPTSDPVFRLEAQKYWTTSFWRTDPGPQNTSRQTEERLAIGFDGAPSNVISRINPTTGGKARAICVQDKP
jgi:hypothetical protein